MGGRRAGSLLVRRPGPTRQLRVRYRRLFRRWRLPAIRQQREEVFPRGRSPRTVLDELAQIKSTDVTFPTADGRTVRLRCVVRPVPAQDALLARLGLDLPKRLRVPTGVASPAQ